LFPCPILALVLVMPTADGYERRKAVEDTMYEESGLYKNIVWHKQTINNARSLYAILRALSNGIQTGLISGGLFKLEEAYTKVSSQDTSRVPDNAEDEVDFHYVGSAKSQNTRRVPELDDDRRGPTDKGLVLGLEEHVLAPGGVNVIRRDKNVSTSWVSCLRRICC
ncbi:uncharacterized protein THITE_2053585, partial [Thermothielavioides terrestris NRRL 8126]